MSLGSGLTPAYLLGNPYGPLPDYLGGGYYYLRNPKAKPKTKGNRVGPFDTREAAAAAMKADPKANKA